VSLRRAIAEILEIVRRHRLRVPRDLSLLFTMLIIAEGVVAELDPEFRFAEALAPYARRQLISGLSPDGVMRRLEEFGVDIAELAIDLPARLDRLSEAIETGGLEVHLRRDDMDALLAGAGRFANRVAASVLAAAVLDGVVRLVPRRRHGRRVRRLAHQRAGDRLRWTQVFPR
jgi:ubiquinone biosynthesis protein